MYSFSPDDLGFQESNFQLEQTDKVEKQFVVEKNFNMFFE